MLPDDTATPELHTKFRNSWSLATLVTAINNEGYPTLGTLSDASPYRSASARANDDGSGYKRVLNAVVTAAVRKVEVTAGIPCKPVPATDCTQVSPPISYSIFIRPTPAATTVGYPQSELEGRDKAPNPETFNNEDDSLQNLDGSEDLSNVTIVANPDTPDTYFGEVTGPELCILVRQRESHMPWILHESKHWELCLQIP